ncbi:TRAP transporter small permease [Domibacillus robiginosus]|uniref:TRAP transporter small permease n=1 Tax=Domibacillus robiginosus TaxID=1071054 RepID=UPI00067D8348|nr:TRAP transporter small permease [Domibacillus robiginosus]
MKAIKWLDDHLEEYILVILSIFTVAIVFIQVFMRYVLGDSLVWSEEAARYAFIWMIYIGVSYGIKRNSHLGVDAFSMLFEQKGQLIIGLIANILFFVFAVVMAFYSFDIVERVTRTSPALQLPLTWVYAAPAVGMVLTTIRLIQKMTAQARALKKSGNQDSEKTIDLGDGAKEEVI